ncbi:MAG: YggS family pyridoxal phosphate-dependent enzyme [Lachnospiraceae bacterium]|nr:YggS family pyridoxal phosphate-dependent enzyme [Lachnospiraceae bacterium]
MNRMKIKENLAEIEKNITAACVLSGRERSEVTLAAVSKNNPPENIMAAYENGIRIFGENRVQELTAKMEVLPTDIEWHLIGHLQRNKVKYIIGKVALIHSVDSLKLAREISKEAAKNNIIQDILIEVNVASEDTKHGVSCAEAANLIKEIAYLQGIKIKGLMTIAPYVINAEENRRYFKLLKQLSVDIAVKNVDNINVDLKILSMGMTGDYEVAISEGADIVRIGTGIFN